MTDTTINEVYTKFLSLEPTEKEYLAELIARQMIDVKRELIKLQAEESEDDYKAGNYKSGSSSDLIKDLTDYYVI
jgi:hypothetical protein